MRRLIACSIALGWLSTATSAHGSPSETRWTHFGLRPLAMGNAYVAVADDYNALFYNPAGLARLKTWDGEFLNPGFEISKNVKNLVDEVKDNSDRGMDKILDLIDHYAGEDQHFGFQWTPHLIFPNFGLGIGLQLDISAAWHRQIAVDLRVGPEIIIPIAFAMNFFDDRLSIGVAAKGRGKLGIDNQFTLEDIETLSSDKNKEKGAGAENKEIDDYLIAGVGVGADVGILFTPTETMAPTIGVSVTDIGGTVYEKIDAAGDLGQTPTRVLPSVNVGFSLKPVQVGRMYVLTSMDMHSINHPYSFSKKLNLGTEIGFGSFIKAQAGLYQGYLSAGTQFDVGILNMRFVTYAVEYGKYPGKQENRRYAFQIKLLL